MTAVNQSGGPESTEIRGARAAAAITAVVPDSDLPPFTASSEYS
jgi:hypothetical protein